MLIDCQGRRSKKWDFCINQCVYGAFFTHCRAFWRSKLRIIASYIFMNGSRRYSNHYGLEAQNYSRRIIFHDFLEFASRRGYSLYFHDFSGSEHLEYLMYELTTDLHFFKTEDTLDTRYLFISPFSGGLLAVFTMKTSYKSYLTYTSLFLRRTKVLDQIHVTDNYY